MTSSACRAGSIETWFRLSSLIGGYHLLWFPYNYATPCKDSNGGLILFLDNNREAEFSNSLIKWVWKISGDAKGSFPSRDVRPLLEQALTP